MQPNHPEEEYKDGEDSGEDTKRMTQKRKHVEELVKMIQVKIRLTQKRKREEQLEQLQEIINSGGISWDEKIKQVRGWLDLNKHNTALLEYVSEKDEKMPPIFLILSVDEVTVDLLETLVKHAPKAVQLSKYLGDSPLHYVLRQIEKKNTKIPLDVITILLKLYPEIAMVRNDHGMLPIHCGAYKNKEIIQLLLKAYPEGATVQNGLGWLPLHLAVLFDGCRNVIKVLLDEFPEGVKVTDNLGRLPLHHLCAKQNAVKKLDVCLLSQMIEPYPGSITQKNIDGDDPSNLLRTLNPWRINRPRNIIPAQRRARLRSRMRLKIACALHEAVVGMFSPYLVKLLIKASPKSCKSRDQKGRIPLHHACASDTLGSLDIVIVLLEACQESFMIPDKQGITPSQLLSNVASQKNDSGMLLLHRHARYSNRFTLSALHYLLNANMKGIEERDNQGMLPIHHACLNAASSVDTLMTLLQLYPQSISELDG